VGLWKNREDKPATTGDAKHAKPNDKVKPLPISKEEQLKRDVELIDNAYKKGENVTHPGIQANENLKGTGKRKKPKK
jgi:hypothetical protein